LEKIYLGGNQIHDDGAKALAEVVADAHANVAWNG
jgi:hypothetical protein